MSKIDIKKTTKTPRIIGDTALGNLSISGKSLPENAREFYEPLMLWFSELEKDHPENITIDLDYEYYNTSSSSILFKVLDSLRKLSSKSNMKVTWHYEEDDLEMEEIGQDFQNVMGDIFILKPKANLEKTDWLK